MSIFRSRYNALPSNTTDGETHLASSTWTVDRDKEFLFGVGHQHSGALNVSVFHNDEYICSSYAIYGDTVGKVGDEKGHLVEMTRCLEANGTRSYPGFPAGSYRKTSWAVKKGDKIRVDGWYHVGPEDPRIAPTPAGVHLGVMSYFYSIFVNGTV